MSWAKGAIDGFLLTALVLDDADATRAAPRVSAPARDAVARALEADAALAPSERAERQRATARALRAAPSTRADLSHRARSLLATSVPRETGRAWLADAPPVRRGFAPDARLVDTLRRAARATPPAGDRAAETGRGRRVLAVATRTLGRDSVERLLHTLGPAEAAAVLALAPLLGDQDVADDGAVAALAPLVAGLRAPFTDAPAALGRLALGMTGVAPRSGGMFERAGAEIAELGGPAV